MVADGEEGVEALDEGRSPVEEVGDALDDAGCVDAGTGMCSERGMREKKK